MSVSDPLLKILKGHILKLRTQEDKITDYNPTLNSFCDTLEQIFRKGLKRQATLFGLSKKDFWSWISDLHEFIPLNRINPALTYTVSAVKGCKKTRTVTGRGRLFIRYGLARKCIDISVAYIRKIPYLLEEWYEAGTSIIGNEILSEILLSLLEQTNQIRFQLNLENASFLDESWLIPLNRRFEFVPTKVLGIRIRYVRGRAVATEIQEESPAALRNLEVGDVLDQLFDIPLNGVNESKIPSILKDAQGIPIYLTVVKAHYFNNRVYPPIAERLREIGISVGNMEANYHIEEAKEEPKDSDTTKSSSNGYTVKYLGSAEVGSYGGVKMIEPGIVSVLKKGMETAQTDGVQVHHQVCTLQLTESHVTCSTSDEGGEGGEGGEERVISRHSYTEISSCGKRIRDLLIFAYIVGDTTCTISEKFICHVFEAQRADDTKSILHSIAQGFERTHWLM